MCCFFVILGGGFAFRVFVDCPAIAPPEIRIRFQKALLETGKQIDMVILPVDPDDIPAVVLPILLAVNKHAFQTAAAAKLNKAQGDTLGVCTLLNQSRVNRRRTGRITAGR